MKFLFLFSFLFFLSLISHPFVSGVDIPPKVPEKLTGEFITGMYSANWLNTYGPMKMEKTFFIKCLQAELDYCLNKSKEYEGKSENPFSGFIERINALMKLFNELSDGEYTKLAQDRYGLRDILAARLAQFQALPATPELTKMIEEIKRQQARPVAPLNTLHVFERPSSAEDMAMAALLFDIKIYDLEHSATASSKLTKCQISGMKFLKSSHIAVGYVRAAYKYGPGIKQMRWGDATCVGPEIEQPETPAPAASQSTPPVQQNPQVRPADHPKPQIQPAPIAQTQTSAPANSQTSRARRRRNSFRGSVAEIFSGLDSDNQIIENSPQPIRAKYYRKSANPRVRINVQVN